MPLQGKLGFRELADLLRVVDVRQKSGVLRIRWEARNAKLFFNRGELLRAESSQFSDRIGDVLVSRGVLARPDVDRALARQAEEGGRRRLGAILHDDYGVADATIQGALTAQFTAIVFDLLSWPEGIFEFDFTPPSQMPERFALGATDFILRVGIEAGLLTGEDLKGMRAVLHEPDDAFAETFLALLRAEGIDARRSLSPEEAATALAGGLGAAALLVSVDAPEAVATILAVKKARAAAPVVAYGPAGAGWRNGELASLVDAFVARPDDAGDAGLKVFLHLVLGAVTTLREE